MAAKARRAQRVRNHYGVRADGDAPRGKKMKAKYAHHMERLLGEKKVTSEDIEDDGAVFSILKRSGGK